MKNKTISLHKIAVLYLDSSDHWRYSPFWPCFTKADALRKMSRAGFTHYEFNNKIHRIPKRYKIISNVKDD